jgi:hypothetical protein
MKTTNKRQISKTECQSRVKHDITKKKSMQDTNHHSDQHLYFVERVRFESCI